jgi:hypothetical protein
VVRIHAGEPALVRCLRTSVKTRIELEPLTGQALTIARQTESVDAGEQSTRKAESICFWRAYHVGWGWHASESQADTPSIDVGGMAYTVAELRAGAEPTIDVATYRPASARIPVLHDARPAKQRRDEYLETHLRAGVLGIGEIGLPLESDSSKMKATYGIARAWDVPVPMHFEHARCAAGVPCFNRLKARRNNVRGGRSARTAPRAR